MKTQSHEIQLLINFIFYVKRDDCIFKKFDACFLSYFINLAALFLEKMSNKVGLKENGIKSKAIKKERVTSTENDIDLIGWVKKETQKVF